MKLKNEVQLNGLPQTPFSFARQQLFEHLAATHNLHALESELDDIEYYAVQVSKARQSKGAPVGFIQKSQAAKVLGATQRTVDNWMRKKIIPHYKVGRRVFFKESELLTAIEKCRVETK